MVTSGAEGAAAAAAIANAIRASGAIVRVEPQDFMAILSRSQTPLVVAARGGLFSRKYEYLTSYKGLAFFTKSAEPLMLSGNVELVQAGKIWIPG
jgi:hypothetical protein